MRKIRRDITKIIAIMLCIFTVFTTVDCSYVLTANAAEVTPESIDNEKLPGDGEKTENIKEDDDPVAPEDEPEETEEAADDESNKQEENLEMLPDVILVDKSEVEAIEESETESVNQPRSGSVVAIETSHEESVSAEDDGFESEELYEMYAAKELGLIPDDFSSFSVDYAGNNLTGNEEKFYNALIPKVKAVADGELASAVFEFTPSGLGMKTSYNLEELNAYFDDDASIDYIVSNGEINPLIGAIFTDAVSFDLQTTLDSLLADCPYELYWFAKSHSGSFSYAYTLGYSASSTSVEFSDSTVLTVKMYVDSDFQNGGAYTVDTTKTAAAKVAASNINEILTAASTKSDYEKLKYYKDQICAKVTYDTVAASKISDTDVPIAPWQLINVFDNNPSTNVVCEGYSKAFAYLCEKTLFNSSEVYAYTVSGPMAGGTGEGPHMWNVVHMSNDKNYMVDVTNCDDGSIGYENILFMRGYSEAIENGYKFSIPEIEDTISYTYDTNTRGIYTVDELTLADTDYDPDSEGSDTTGPTLTLTPNSNDSAVSVEGVTYGYEDAVTILVEFSDTSGIDTSAVKFKDSAGDGSWTTVDASNLTNNADTYSFGIDVNSRGQHDILVHVEDANNYQTEEEVTVYIYKTVPDDMTLTGVSGGVTYDGSVIEEEVDFSLSTATEGFDTEGVEYYYKKGAGVYAPGLPTDAGTYTIKASFTAENYYKEKDITGEVIINKADSSFDVNAAATVEKKVGDEPFTIEVSNKVGDGNITYTSDNTSVATVDENGEVTIVGEGTAKITVDLAESDNYNASYIYVDLTVDYIEAPSTILYNGLAEKTWYNISDGDVNISATGYTVSTSLNGDYDEYVEIPYSADGTESLDVYFKNSDGQKSDKVTVDVRYDHTAPSYPADGGIKIADNIWKTLLNTISFGRIYKDSKDVTVSASDATGGSGIDKYFYYVDKTGSTSAFTAEQLDEKTFTPSTNSKIDTISTDSNYVYYVYVTDAAGNRSPYICSDGVIYDNTAPEMQSANVVANSIAGTSFQLCANATDSVSGVKNYYLVYQQAASDSDTLESTVTSANIESVAGKLVSADGLFTVTGLTKRTRYIYAVAAVDNSGLISNVMYGSVTTTASLPTFNAEDIPKITGVYGQKISEMTLSSTSGTSKEGVAGTWSITASNGTDTSDLRPYGSNQTWKVTFTPNSLVDYDSAIFNANLNLTALPGAGIDIQKVAVAGNEGWYLGAVVIKPALETNYDLAAELKTIDTSIGTCLDYENTTWYSSLPSVTEDGTTEVTFFVRDKSTGEVTVQQTASIKIDATAPTGTISIATDNWTTFLNSITFGKFFKETKEVTISSSDATSGILKTQYYKSATEKTLDEIKGLAESSWTTKDNFSIVPNEKVIIYAKITDKAGNATYICSTGLIFDKDAPNITITPSGTAYAPGGADAYDDSVSITISAADNAEGCGLASLSYKLDGGAANNHTSGESVTVNTAGSHTIEVTAEDNAGNTATDSISFKVYKASPAISITPVSGVKYDGSVIEEGTDFNVDRNGNEGTISYSYKVKADAEGTYQAGLPTDPGTYTLKASIPENTTTCLKDVQATADITIEKGEATLSVENSTINKKLGDAAFALGVTKTGDGTITYASSNESVATVDSSGLVTIVGTGSAEITASMAATTYYDAATDKKVTVNVTNIDSPTVLYNGGAKKTWFNTLDGNVVVSATGYTVAESVNGTYTASNTFTYSGDGEVSKTLYFKNSQGQITDGVEVKVKYDRNAPSFPADGGIKIAENSWRTLLNTITFGTLFTETKSVTVSAEDATGGSGIDNYYYYVDKSGSTSVLTSEQLAGKTFTASSSSTIDNLSTDSKYVYYVYVTDIAGNKSSYICSDGIVLDTVAPNISSVTVPEETLTDSGAVVTVSATDAGTGVKEYYLVAADSSLEATIDKTNIASNANKKTSSTGSFSFTGLTSNKKYYYAVAAVDNCNQVSEVSYGNFTTKKLSLDFDSEPTISGVLGQKLSEMTLSKTTDTSTGGVSGTWSITQANKDSVYPLVNGTTQYEVTFTPNSGDYEPYLISVVPTVSYLGVDEVASVSGNISYNGWYISDVTVTAPSGYKITSALNTTNLSSTSWANSLPAISTEGSTTQTYYLKSDATGTISAPKNVIIKKDTVSPTGKITVGSNAWNTFLSSITFNTVIKGTKTVTISASDAASGVAKTEYYKTSSPKSIEEIKALNDGAWTTGNSFSVSPTIKLVVYARITDNAGNVVYISSGGMSFEESASSSSSSSSSSGSTKTTSSSITTTLPVTSTTTTTTGATTTTTGATTTAKTTTTGTTTTNSTKTTTTTQTTEANKTAEDTTTTSNVETTSESQMVSLPEETKASEESVFTSAEQQSTYVAPGKEIVSQEVVTNDDGSTTTIASHSDGTVCETTTLTKAAESLNSQSASNKTAPTRISKVEIAVDKAGPGESAVIEKVTTVLDAVTKNGAIGITPEMVTVLSNEVNKKVGESIGKDGFDIKVNTLASDGKEISMTVSSYDLKNRAKLTAYAIDPETGSYVLTNVPAAKYNKKTGLAVTGLSGGKEYRLLSAKEARKVNKSILKTVKVADAYKKPVAAKKGETLDMSKAISSGLNTANVSKIEYTVSGKKASIDKQTGQLSINNNAKNGTVRVKIKVTLNNGKTKKIKAKVKIQ